jgi:phosphatidylglycerol lysyltransferase
MWVKRLSTHVKTKSALLLIVSLATLGSGLLNLFSLIGPGLPNRLRALHEFFPMAFLHISRFLTLIIGFTLVVTSINIYKRKKRAYHIVLLLLSLSVIFHMTKGLDYEEATLSLILIFLLLSVRSVFTVRSGVPDPGSWGIRLLLALLAAFTYGVLGFWFLDRREFGINFHLADSVHRTFEYLVLIGNPDLIPRTRYARWFLDSLYVISIMAIAYSIFSVFIPVIYKYRTHPRERLLAKGIAEKYGSDSQDYFKLWADKSFFFSPSRNSFIAYGVWSNFAVALADPVGPDDEIEETVRSFMEFCRENDWRVAFHQARTHFLTVFKKLGFRKLKIGDDAIVDLKCFSISGNRMKDIRNTINRIEKSGIRVKIFEPPVHDETIHELKDVSDEWLRIPGRRERGFTLGMFDPHYIKSTEVLAAEDEQGRVLAFVNIIPSFRAGEATIDLMRRREETPNGVIDYLIVKLLELLKSKGYERFNLGMAPMSGLREDDEASIEEKTIYYFSKRMNFLFSFAGLKLHKSKFATYWEPRYTIYRNTRDLPKLALAIGNLTELHGQKVGFE